ncbi:SgcJ/EcaC family oxidoreductase [Micromonospora sp. WMMD1082]|uniref:SgcJ/EcaC family oxidoreductase n=1 Tax=Micromonospora sp. WMMD1082 TaxID=3016104 RepID=UPI002417E365|nr:SgcJ/EcaC family oxidoreductase [Micromonospora sp. WMMD1082]MDG4792774.1 SgcJ/EcaC family oxidoreductase [Micromonospora sp. WMMD1082]
MTTTNGWGDASTILASASVSEDTTYYREFTRPDEKAALTVPMRIQAAWAANDPQAFAGTFADNGSLLLGDEQLRSRAEILAYMTDAFAGPLHGASVKGWPIEVRFLSQDVAVVITEGGIRRPGEAAVAPENAIRATWVIRRQPDGRHQLVSHQSSPIKS